MPLPMFVQYFLYAFSNFAVQDANPVDQVPGHRFVDQKLRLLFFLAIRVIGSGSPLLRIRKREVYHFQIIDSISEGSHCRKSMSVCENEIEVGFGNGLCGRGKVDDIRLIDFLDIPARVQPIEHR